MHPYAETVSNELITSVSTATSEWLTGSHSTQRMSEHEEINLG